MKFLAFSKLFVIAFSLVSLPLASAFSQVALRRPISADNPIIFVNTKLWLVDSVGTNTYYDIELHDAWANIPADLKPYCALTADPGKIVCTEADVDKWVAACQSIGAPCILQAVQCNRAVFDPDGLIADKRNI